MEPKSNLILLEQFERAVQMNERANVEALVADALGLPRRTGRVLDPWPLRTEILRRMAHGTRGHPTLDPELAPE